MTLRAEDFTKTGITEQSRALKSVELMNRGIEEKVYELYRQGIIGLMGAFKTDKPKQQDIMQRKIIKMDAVARFVDEVQGIEMGLENKPFRTRIGIGELFMNPTMEVLDAKTGDVLAVFADIGGYQLVSSMQVQIEQAQDRFIVQQKRRSELQRQIKRTQAVLREPGKMNGELYDDLLIDPYEAKFGIFQGFYLTILRKKHADYYASQDGQAMLTNEIEILESELAEIQENLDVYVERISECRKQMEQEKEQQEVFVGLMNRYQVPLAKRYQDKIQPA